MQLAQLPCLPSLPRLFLHSFCAVRCLYTGLWRPLLLAGCTVPRVRLLPYAGIVRSSSHGAILVPMQNGVKIPTFSCDFCPFDVEQGYAHPRTTLRIRRNTILRDLEGPLQLWKICAVRDVWEI